MSHNISITLHFPGSFPQQMQVHQHNIFHVTGRESGTPHSRNRSLDSPLSLFPDETHPVPHSTETERPSTSSSGTYQSKFKEHMLTGTALCVQPVFSQQPYKARPWQKAVEALKGGTRTRARENTSLPPGGRWGCEEWRWRFHSELTLLHTLLCCLWPRKEKEKHKWPGRLKWRLKMSSMWIQTE